MEKRLADIEENLKRIRCEMAEAALSAGRNPADVRLMAVTKTVPAEVVNLAVDLGVDLLGENRAQELCAKYGAYEKDGVEIHFIGHLQSNKVRQVMDKVSAIHSLDSLRLAAEIDRQAGKLEKVCDVLIEVNVGGEESKSGVEPEEVLSLAGELAGFSSLRLRGLMTIPPICDTMEQSERYFSRVEQLFIDMQAKNRDNRNIDIVSMGMSGDFPAAIRHGATMVRIGTALFGGRT